MRNKERSIICLLAVVIICTVFSINRVNAADTSIGTDGSTVNLSLWSYTQNGDAYILDKYTGSIADGRIIGSVPATINGLPVTKMTDTFNGCTTLIQAPQIPSTVTSIRSTFSGCSGLTNAPVIPESVTDMNSTFRDCTSLVQAPVIPDDVTNMGGTFFGCTSLKQVPRLPNNVISLYYTFCFCESLTELPEIPNGVMNMESTFRGCTSLTQSPVIPESVTDMISTFRDCTSLVQGPVISDNVTNMSGTFYGCTSLKQVPRLPSNIVSLYYTFYFCESLTKSPEIPKGVINLDSTYIACRSLTQAPEIPASVRNMSRTFYECTSLNQATELPSGVTSLYYTFYNCSSLTHSPKIPNGVINMESTFRGCTNLTQAPKLPDSLVKLSYTFGNCSSLTQAPVIPENVTDMGFAFRQCNGLTSAPLIPPNVTNLEGAFSLDTSLAGDVYIPNKITNLNNIFVCTEKPINMIYSSNNTVAALYEAPSNVTKTVDTALPEIISITEKDTFNITIIAFDDSIIAGYAVTTSPIHPEKGWQISNGFLNLTVGKYYAWAIDRVGNISSRKEFIIFDKNVVPEIKAAPSGTYINFTWTPVENIWNYEIELDGKVIKTGFRTSYTYKSLKPSTQHTYRIRALCVLGTSNWSPLQTIYTTDGKIKTAPQNIISIVRNTTITLTWDAVDEAEGYDITSISPDGTIGTIIDNGRLTTCELRGLSPNTAYKYKIRGKNSAGEGPWSDELGATTYLLDTPQNIVLLKSDTSIKFTWEEVLNADAYELKYYEIVHTNGVTGSAINIQIPNSTGVTTNVIGTTITITELTPCTEYKYSIRAKSSQGYSSWREEKSTFTLPQRPDIPRNVNAIVSESKITVNWVEASDASIVGYDVELDGIILENDTENIYIHEGLEPYSVHTYRVRSRNELVEGEWSPLNSIRTLPAKPTEPKEIAIKSTQTGATLSWRAEPGAAGYDLYIFKLDDNDKEIMLEQINNIEECTYTHRRQTKGEEYRYRIRTRNIHGTSSWSGDIINNAIKAQCKKNNTIDLGLTATDVVDFSSYEMVVTYNPGVVEVIDLSTVTGKNELKAGKIEGTDITIKEFSNGRIVFVVDKAVTLGEAWTGVINGIKFKAKQSGGTTITYTVYTQAQQEQ